MLSKALSEALSETLFEVELLGLPLHMSLWGLFLVLQLLCIIVFVAFYVSIKSKLKEEEYYEHFGEPQRILKFMGLKKIPMIIALVCMIPIGLGTIELTEGYSPSGDWYKYTEFSSGGATRSWITYKEGLSEELNRLLYIFAFPPLIVLLETFLAYIFFKSITDVIKQR